MLATDDPVALAVATSGALFASAPVAVLAGPADATRAAESAQGVPLLLVPDGPDAAGVGAELDRLGTTTVLPVGDAAGAGAEGWAGRGTGRTGGRGSAPARRRRGRRRHAP